MISLDCNHPSNTAQIMENAEINNIIKIIGLQYKQKYEDPDSLKSLRCHSVLSYFHLHNNFFLFFFSNIWLNFFSNL